MRIDGFRAKEAYFADINQWIERMKSATPTNAHEPVMVHGEIEHYETQHRTTNGIPLVQAVIDDLSKLGNEHGVPWVL
jgi:LDH2 family malate/lactate/ureidoglycolate dehydrogenase